jgi:hypothetical protein
VKDEEDLDMQDEEGEANVKIEKGIGSEEEECRGIKDEEGMYSEEEDEVEDVDTKGEVSLEGTIQCFRKQMLYQIKLFIYLYVSMSLIRHIATVFRNVSCVWFIHIYSHCKQLHCWE